MLKNRGALRKRVGLSNPSEQRNQFLVTAVFPCQLPMTHTDTAEINKFVIEALTFEFNFNSFF
jgi:hypothetical protein